MNSEKINYIIDNFDNIKRNDDSLQNFVDYLNKLDLSTLEPVLQQKITGFLERINNQNKHSKSKSIKKIIKSKPFKIIFVCLVIIAIIFFNYYYSNNELYCVVDNNDEYNQRGTPGRFLAYIKFDDNKKAVSAKIQSTIFSKIVELNDKERIKFRLDLSSLDYDKVKNVFLNRGYKCNNEKKRDIDLEYAFSNGIINNDQIYFFSNENILSSVDLNGNDKKNLVKIDDIKTYSFTKKILNDNYYIYNYSDNSGKIIKISLNKPYDVSYIDVTDVSKADFEKISGIFFDFYLASIYGDYNYSRIIYNDEFVYNYENNIYIGDKVVYSGKNHVLPLSINDDFLYLAEETSNDKQLKLIKLNLNTGLIENEIDFQLNTTIDDLKYTYEYNENGIVFFTKDGIFKMNYNFFNLKKIMELDLEGVYEVQKFYVNNKIIVIYNYTSDYEEILNFYKDGHKIVVYDELNQKTVEYKCNGFQIVNDYLYLFNGDKEEPIKKIKLD